MTSFKLTAGLGLSALLLGACSQHPYIKDQYRDGRMLNAAEVDNQSKRRAVIENMKDAPKGSPTPGPVPVPSATLVFTPAAKN